MAYNDYNNNYNDYRGGAGEGQPQGAYPQGGGQQQGSQQNQGEQGNAQKGTKNRAERDSLFFANMSGFFYVSDNGKSVGGVSANGNRWEIGTVMVSVGPRRGESNTTTKIFLKSYNTYFSKIINGLKKGDRIVASAHPETHMYEGDYRTDWIVDQLSVTSRASDQTQGTEQAQGSYSQPQGGGTYPQGGYQQRNGQSQSGYPQGTGQPHDNRQPQGGSSYPQAQGGGNYPQGGGYPQNSGQQTGGGQPQGGYPQSGNGYPHNGGQPQNSYPQGSGQPQGSSYTPSGFGNPDDDDDPFGLQGGAPSSY